MMNKIVSTKRFWELMCDASFCRIDFHTGRMPGITYKVTDPPESVEGFMENKTSCFIEKLNGNMNTCNNPRIFAGLTKSLRDRFK
jgi:hypothetical protein